MKEPVYIPAPEYGSPTDRQTVIKILLSLAEQIEVLDKGYENSQTHADPPKLQRSASDPEICTLCIKAQPRNSEDTVEDEGSPAQHCRKMAPSRFFHPVNEALYGYHIPSPPFLR